MLCPASWIKKVLIIFRWSFKAFYNEITISYGRYHMTRGDTMPKWLICGKLKKISKQINGFLFIFFIYRLSSGLLVRGITENIRQFLLRFFNRQSSLIRYKILVFCNLKICLAVPSGSHYYLMMHYRCG